MTTFEKIQAAAAELGVEVERLPGEPRWCRLVLPSRIRPDRRLPPLLLTTAEKILKDLG